VISAAAGAAVYPVAIARQKSDEGHDQMSL
jgi:hypothetical protein